MDAECVFSRDKFRSAGLSEESLQRMDPVAVLEHAKLGPMIMVI